MAGRSTDLSLCEHSREQHKIQSIFITHLHAWNPVYRNFLNKIRKSVNNINTKQANNTRYINNNPQPNHSIEERVRSLFVCFLTPDSYTDGCRLLHVIMSSLIKDIERDDQFPKSTAQICYVVYHAGSNLTLSKQLVAYMNDSNNVKCTAFNFIQTARIKVNSQGHVTKQRQITMENKVLKQQLHTSVCATH